MESSKGVMTLSRHIMEQERTHPGATGEFTGLMSDLAVAAKIVGRSVNKAGLVDVLGLTGDENVFGEEVKKMDEIANTTIIRALDHGGHLCAMVSEENRGIIKIPEKYKKGKYVFLFDPLDGSSNIDVNVSIGTIFSIYRRISESGDGTLEDCLQPGYKQEAAGYILYGSSTMFVYSAGHGVHGFTFDPGIGEFLLSNENMNIPEKGSIISANMGYINRWNENIQRYFRYIAEEDFSTNRPYGLRYIGSLIADFHRSLFYGGVFLYPADNKNPNGKLRLLYEANPLAFLAVQAGGAASDGFNGILQKKPTVLAQRVPLIIGSKDEVKLVEEFMQGKR